MGSTLSSDRADGILRKTLANPYRVFFDRKIAAFVCVDLTDWYCREHFFTGRYPDQLVPLLVRTFLKNGGMFGDVGSNRGLHALYAARFLDNRAHRGCVYAFEPNPKAFKVLEAHLEINGVRNGKIYNLGISDEEGTLSLSTTAHTGMSSFCAVPSQGGASVDVDVRTLEDALGIACCDGPVILKIDVEGWEHKVLTGAGPLLDNPQMLVVCEVTDEWLRRAGSSAADLFSFMYSKGYRTFHCKIVRSALAIQKLRLSELSEPLVSPKQYDVFFARGLP